MPRYRSLFAILAGILLGLSFPPFSSGALAMVAFVPLFFALREENFRSGLRYSYVCFLVFNLITLYWTGGFTHGKDLYLMAAGSLLILAHPFFFLIPIAAWIYFRRHFGMNRSLVAFPFFWVTFEYVHSRTQLSFPWISLGNTQTYDLSLIQFISCTGASGLSFLILCLNVLVYFWIHQIAHRGWKPLSAKSVLLLGLIAALYILPKWYGESVIAEKIPPSTTTVRVGVVQPNIDPFEKWQGNAERQLSEIQQITDRLGGTDLILWPETAVPGYVLHPSNAGVFERIRRQVDSLSINLLTGIPDLVYYTGKYPESSKKAPNGDRYDTFNSSMLLRPNSPQIQKYAKIVLVPFAERVPFAEEFSFLNAARWNFGLGGWAPGTDTALLHFTTGKGLQVRFSTMICYESVYPELVASFVRKGAEFLTVITNDSWWGNTSGAYQHKQFSVLRAVENRRWMVQCANGGISCVVDPLGIIRDETKMFTQASLIAGVEPRHDLTYYTLHGDWLGELCGVIASFLLASAVGMSVFRRMRT